MEKYYYQVPGNKAESEHFYTLVVLWIKQMKSVNC